MNKRIIVTIAIIAALTVPFSVFAATSTTSAAKSIRGFFGIDTSKLTEQQKTDVKDYSQKLSNLQKDFINKMVSNGTLSKEQGDAEIKRIDEDLANNSKTGAIPGFGFGKSGRGMKGDFGMGALDTSKLTDSQKADLLATGKKMADLQKELITKMVTNGLLTKEQGDSAMKKAEEVLSEIEKTGVTNSLNFLKGFSGFGMKMMGGSKLTDVQKADLNAFSSKMKELQKELINKLIASGVMTQEQGNAAIQRVDSMGTAPMNPGASKGFEMKKGNFGRRNHQKLPATDTNSSASTTPPQS